MVAWPTLEQIWTDCCEVSLDIRARYGLKASIDYLAGDKLMMFAQTGENSPEFLAELPAFSKRTRCIIQLSRLQVRAPQCTQTRTLPLYRYPSQNLYAPIPRNDIGIPRLCNLPIYSSKDRRILQILRIL
jgi:hypothetical protein